MVVREVDLERRAKKSIYNIDEISDKIVKKACNDAIDITKGKDIKYQFAEDYAFIRLKIYLKIELSSTDELLYKEALKAIKEANLIADGGDIKPRHIIKVATRQGVVL